MSRVACLCGCADRVQCMSRGGRLTRRALRRRLRALPQPGRLACVVLQPRCPDGIPTDWSPSGGHLRRLPSERVVNADRPELRGLPSCRRHSRWRVRPGLRSLPQHGHVPRRKDSEMIDGNRLRRFTLIMCGLSSFVCTAVFAQDEFDHFSTGFELFGAHANVECSRCHVGGDFRVSDSRCVSCHSDFGTVRASAAPFDHIASSDICTDCHTTSAWNRP